MLNILSVGSSEIIKKFISKKFQKDNIEYIPFRESWKEITKSNYDIIIVSGFHFEIASMRLKKFELYINDYFEYLRNLSIKCKQIYLVSTDLKLKISYSRIVYFYFLLIQKIKFKNLDIKILSFNSLLNLNQDRIKIFIYKILKKKFHTDYLMNKNLEELILNDILEIDFKFILFPRTRNIDRLIRIFDK